MSLNFHTYWLNYLLSAPRNLLFLTFGRPCLWPLYLRILGRALRPKTTVPLVFFLWLVRSWKTCNIRLSDHLEKFNFFSDFQYGFRFFWSTADLLAVVYDIILSAFDRSVATGALTLDSCKTFDFREFCMLFFSTNLSFMEFLVRYLAFFCLFSVIDDFEWFWMESLHKNIQLIMVLLKALFLVQHYSYNELIKFPMMLSVILPSLLMILLSTLSVIKHLICGNNQSWLLNLNLT